MWFFLYVYYNNGLMLFFKTQSLKSTDSIGYDPLDKKLKFFCLKQNILEMGYQTS